MFFQSLSCSASWILEASRYMETLELAPGSMFIVPASVLQELLTSYVAHSGESVCFCEQHEHCAH